MRNKTIVGLALAAGLLGGAPLCQQSQATQITGTVDFGGWAVLDTGNAETATAVRYWLFGLTLNGTGDLTSSGEVVTFHAPWNFETSATIEKFWKFGGFMFDLDQSSVLQQGGGLVKVIGTGVMYGNGYDPTPGVWSFSTHNPAAAEIGPFSIFTFSAGGGALPGAVPDGGTAVGLLGFALVAVEGFRRWWGR